MAEIHVEPPPRTALDTLDTHIPEVDTIDPQGALAVKAFQPHTLFYPAEFIPWLITQFLLLVSVENAENGGNDRTEGFQGVRRSGSRT